MVRHAAHKLTNSVYLFGDFQIFNRRGEDVVHNLPPKVRELFLMMLTSSFKPFNYISNKTMNSHLWPDHNPEQVKNNRSVSVNKLRSALDEVDGIKICCDRTFWWVELAEEFYCDYERYLSILFNRSFTHSSVLELSGILSRGEFMKEHDYEWFENNRMKLTDTALHKLKEQLQKQKDHSAFNTLIAENILRLDPLSETALKVKIQSLVREGEHTAAQATFEHFIREYMRIYSVEYNKSFNEMLNKN